MVRAYNLTNPNPSNKGAKVAHPGGLTTSPRHPFHGGSKLVVRGGDIRLRCLSVNAGPPHHPHHATPRWLSSRPPPLTPAEGLVGLSPAAFGHSATRLRLAKPDNQKANLTAAAGVSRLVTPSHLAGPPATQNCYLRVGCFLRPHQPRRYKAHPPSPKPPTEATTTHSEPTAGLLPTRPPWAGVPQPPAA